MTCRRREPNIMLYISTFYNVILLYTGILIWIDRAVCNKHKKSAIPYNFNAGLSDGICTRCMQKTQMKLYKHFMPSAIMIVYVYYEYMASQKRDSI